MSLCGSHEVYTPPPCVGGGGLHSGQRARTKVLRSVPYGAYVVGTRSREGPHLMFGNWFTQTSFDPSLVAFSLERDSRTLALVRSRKRFAVSFLTKEGGAVANAVLAGKSVETTSAPGGSPIIKGAWGWLECDLVKTVTTGDHVMIVGAVRHASVSPRGRPLSLSEAGMNYGG